MSFVFERPDLAQESAPRTRSSSRRTHTKSRLGCQACKQRRIKCDETTPACGQCRDKDVQCIYNHRTTTENHHAQTGNQTSPLDSTRPGQVSAGVATSVSPQSTATTSSPVAVQPPPPPPEPITADIAKAHMLRNLELINVPKTTPHSRVSYQLHHVPHLLDHFANTSIPWAGSPQCQRVLQTWAFTLATTNIFLLHGILAFSASHLHTLHPQEARYGMAASLHYGLSLSGFASSLGEAVNGENADALFACCYLHAMLAFHNKRRLDEPHAQDHDFAWLRLMKGIPILQRTNVLRPHLNKSLWMPVFIESGAFSPKTGPLPEPAVPECAANDELEALRVDCGVAPGLDDKSPYATPIAHLDRLSRMTIDNSKVGSLMVFIGRMPEAFVRRLEMLDLRAIKILQYWCKLADGVDQWWCRRPAREESERLALVIEDRESLPTPESMG